MHFRLNYFGIHYYEPSEEFTFVATGTYNKKHYSKRQIKAEVRAEELYGTLTYPSVADYRWATQINKIKECPMTVQDIYVAISIWGKDIFAIKLKTTRKKTIPLTEDLI